MLVAGTLLGSGAGGNGAGNLPTFSEHVIKIEVVETGSAARAAIGTGFFAALLVTSSLTIIVISKLIHSRALPRRGNWRGGQTVRATVSAVDVIYDLAILRSDLQPKGFLQFEPTQINKAPDSILWVILRTWV